ncbi:MAG: hypothetical protein AVO35_07150 [Candidatus Aegiribacteria sp. MLS_C]|nr:MAG: hypothetical protein AVO35_07150 [Candidatus Aegiribacteria sp. MLS_C]
MEDSLQVSSFCRILQLPTVSRQPGEGTDMEPFLATGRLLRELFPRVHAKCRLETVGGASLLFTLEGRDPVLAPVMMTAHLDVVPAEDGEGWPFPPFSGTVSEGRVWGRGAVDYKIGVSAMLQALEQLLEMGFSPERTLYLSFGHDEEVGGDLGARRITSLLEERGVRLSSVLDEGGYIYDYPWLDREVAVVGLAEKGYLTLRLIAAGEQGHASVPGTETACGNLCRALARLEDHQMEPLLCGPVRMLLEGTAEMMRHRNEDQDGMIGMLQRHPSGNALVRTTTAITMMGGSTKENIMPSRPWALVNFRAVPGNGSDVIVAHVRALVEDLGVEVEYEDTRQIHEPSAVSSCDSPEYRAIVDALDEVLPGLPVLPGIFPAATDSRHYSRITDNVYRFQPVHLGPRGLSVLHSAGESVSLEDYGTSVEFYGSYIRKVCLDERERG